MMVLVKSYLYRRTDQMATLRNAFCDTFLCNTTVHVATPQKNVLQ